MMKTEQVLVDLDKGLEDPKNHRPTITSWKGERMIRVHSIMATVKQMLQMLNSLDLIKIGIIGEPSTGKTSLALLLAHLFHTTSTIPFAFRIFGEEEFLNMERTLATLGPANYILYFHDLSFLNDRRKIEEVKAAITKIRHLKSDVKIILIYDYHYTLGLDKYLRQANFRFYTSIGSSEFDNMVKTLGTKYTPIVFDFNKKYVEMTTKQTCTFTIRGKPFFTYRYKNPFVNCLFWDNARPRYVIFPKREWLAKTCSECANAYGNLKSSIPVTQFVQEANDKFGKGIFKAAIKLHALLNGLNVYNHNVVQAQRYLARAFETKLISLEELLVVCDLKVTKTNLRKKLDGILAT